MSELRTIIKNIFFLILGGVAARFAFTFIEILVARKLGQELFGIFSTGFVLIMTMIRIIDFGMNWKLVQDGSRQTETIPPNFGTMLFTKTFIFLIGYPVIFLFLNIFNYSPNLIPFFLLFYLFALPMALQESFAAAYQAKQKMEINAIFQAATPGLILVLIYFFIDNQSKLESLSVIYIAGAGFITLIWWVLCWINFHPTIRIGTIPTIIKGSYLYGINGLLFVIYFKIDIIMLSFFKDMSEVGIYSAGYKILEVVAKIPMLFSVVLTPILFKYSKAMPKKYFAIYKISFRFSMIFGLILSGLVYVFAKTIIITTVGNEYQESIIILKILSPYFAVKFLSWSVADILLTSDKQRWTVNCHILSTIINITLNFFLIPLYGGIGAAIATLLAELCLFAAYFLTIQNKLYKLDWSTFLLLPVLLSGTIMTGLAFIPVTNQFVLSGLMITCFLSLLLLFKYVQLQDIQQFWRYLRNKQN